MPFLTAKRSALYLPLVPERGFAELQKQISAVFHAPCAPFLHMTLAAGSKANLAPEMVLNLLAKELGEDPENFAWQIRRMDLLDHELRPLGACGEEA